MAALGLAVELVGTPGWLGERAELASLDLRLRLRGPAPVGDELLIVAIDDRSIARLGRWPLPRDALAAAVRRLREGGAAVVALNLITSEPTGSLPAAVREAIGRIAEGLPPAAALRRELGAVLDLADPDLTLAVAIAESGRVVLPYVVVPDPGQANIGAVPSFVRDTALPLVLELQGRPVLDLDGARWLLVPAPSLAGAAASLGHVNIATDIDGVLRRHLPVVAVAGGNYPSAALEIARLRLGLEPADVVLRTGESLTLGRRRLPLDASSRLLVDANAQGAVPTVSLIDLLDGTVPAERIFGRIVLVGTVVAGAGDWFTTPFARRSHGTEHIAAVVHTLLAGRTVARSALTALVDAASILLLVGLAAALAGRRGPLTSLVAAAGLTAAWLTIAVMAFLAAGTWLGVAVPLGAMLLAAAAVEVLRVQHEQRARRHNERERANLARYFAPAIAQRLAERDSAYALDRTEAAAVMFVDLVGFTGVAQHLPPSEAMDLLRGFHAQVEAAVFEHGGFVDKFIGDGALACFGIPDPTPTAARDALRAAVALLAAMRPRPERPTAHDVPAVRASIGVHFGPVLMGDIGGRQQLQFTVIGDTVNVASRLEHATRELDTQMLVSEAAMQAARAHEPGIERDFERVPAFQLRGREGMLDLWRLTPKDDEDE